MNGTCTETRRNLMTVWKWKTRIQESNFSESIGLVGKVNLSEGSSAFDPQVKQQSSRDGSNQTYSTCQCLLLSSQAHAADAHILLTVTQNMCCVQKSHTCPIYSMGKTVCALSSMCKITVFKKQ